MANGQIDPARLGGDALTQWYLRSPDDIEQERRQAADQRYREFFGGNGGVDPPPGYDAESETPTQDIDTRRRDKTSILDSVGFRSVLTGGAVQVPPPAIHRQIWEQRGPYPPTVALSIPVTLVLALAARRILPLEVSFVPAPRSPRPPRQAPRRALLPRRLVRRRPPTEVLPPPLQCRPPSPRPSEGPPTTHSLRSQTRSMIGSTARRCSGRTWRNRSFLSSARLGRRRPICKTATMAGRHSTA
jgi:hypothetical protein